MPIFTAGPTLELSTAVLAEDTTRTRYQLSSTLHMAEQRRPGYTSSGLIESQDNRESFRTPIIFSREGISEWSCI